MLRPTLLYLSQAPWARQVVTGWRISRYAAARFIAGDTLEEALDVVRRLNAEGLFVTLDHLGENVTNREAALRAADDYIQALDGIESCGVRASISLKLTQLGLPTDYDLCLSNMERILKRAARGGTFVRIDMEHSAVVDDTLRIYSDLRGRGLENVGVVIQAYLYRSQADLRALVEQGARVRLVKGAYMEPPEVAYPRKRDVDANFDRLAAILIEAAAAHGAERASPDGRRPPMAAIATHDEHRIRFARAHAEKVGLPRQALEFQMLHGVRSALQRALASEGYPVRVYVPYGTEWYPYFMRRLAERPANLWFFLRQAFRR